MWHAMFLPLANVAISHDDVTLERGVAHGTSDTGTSSGIPITLHSDGTPWAGLRKFVHVYLRQSFLVAPCAHDNFKLLRMHRKDEQAQRAHGEVSRTCTFTATPQLQLVDERTQATERSGGAKVLSEPPQTCVRHVALVKVVQGSEKPFEGHGRWKTHLCIFDLDVELRLVFHELQHNMDVGLETFLTIHRPRQLEAGGCCAPNCLGTGKEVTVGSKEHGLRRRDWRHGDCFRRRRNAGRTSVR
mmetsp:Transcript_9763/g.27224  ORF Transcript_9763/g.27224 Transcript_9763/m.27224 type:complete len:244 (-) Transcript_9763:1042-1773(-)